MTRSVFSKAMRTGRATIFLVGLAVVLALLFGAATTAMGATGANLILGRFNAAETPTALVSTLSDAIKPALSVNNRSGGPALNLGVAAEQAPIKVNAAAGTATNLSADELDGKDSTEFAFGVNGKATDAAHADQANSATNAQNAQNAQNADTLDGMDSSQFAQRGGFKANTFVWEQGALPKETSFTSNGGTLLVSASGSGYRSGTNTTRDDGLIGMRVIVDGQFRDVAAVYTNGADSHKTFVDSYFTLNLGAGTHTLKLENWNEASCGTTSERNFTACTTTDSGDFFSVSILEIPN